MKNKNLPWLRLPAVVAFLVLSCLGRPCAAGVEPFDQAWRFALGDPAAAESAGYDDSGWQQLDVPHDWSIAGPMAKTNRTGGAGAWAPSGIGWYRKHFVLPQALEGQHVWIRFDGVMQNSEVWVNGTSLGKRPNGYVSFTYDLTAWVKFGSGQTNVVAVRTDTSAQPASRWYSGAGIYRHVWLGITDRMHFEPDSIFVTTPVIQSNAALVRIATRVKNDSAHSREITVAATVSGPPGSAPDGAYATSAESAKVTLTAGEVKDVGVDVSIPWSPRLWDLTHPDLHQAWVRVQAEGKLLDEARVSFGVRHFEFKAETGFWLNGNNFKLYGVCLHHDGSAFGAAVPLAVWERRLMKLRELGVNAIRTAHNPPAPEFLDLCDRLGFLVMDEFFDCWTVGKNPQDYHRYFAEWSKRDAADIVRRDRNHPSVVLYSIGNEIHDTPKPDIALPIARGLVEVCHVNDPSRPVTQALFRPNVSHDYDNGLADLLDVVGTNYRDNELLAAQRAKPGRKIIGTEQRHDRQTWLWLRDNPSHSGQFLWTGVDYLGETKTWPRIGHPSGLLDRTAEIKPMAFERLSWWSHKPMVRMVRRVAADDVLPEDPGYGGEERHTQVQFADWTPRQTTAHEETVEVYSNCEEVELLLNGKSLGAKAINPDASPRVWKLTYQPGLLRAVARTGGKDYATDELRSAGAPAKIILTSERTQLRNVWDDVAFVRAEVVDAQGIVVPRARNLIKFQLAGPGRIVAVDSGDNASIEPFQASQRRAYQGVSYAMVKATAAAGKIVVTAEAEGLQSGSITLEATFHQTNPSK